SVSLPSDTIHEHPGRELVERLRWVIGLRWAVAGVLVLVALIGLTYGSSAPETLAVDLGLAALVFGYNFLYLVASKQPDYGQSNLTTLIRYGQVPIDLLVLTVLVHSTGGVSGPMFVLYFAYILVGLAILPPSGAYWVAGIAIAFYGILAWLEGPLGIA